MLDNVSITGITPLDHYPRLVDSTHYKHCIESCSLCIPTQKPNIESIHELNLKITVEGFTVLNTILGPKIFIHGSKYIKIIYTAATPSQSLHSTYWEVPFCEFILLENMTCAQCIKSISCIFAGTESGHINFCDERRLNVCILFVLCPQFIESCKPDRNAYKNSGDYWDCWDSPESCEGNSNLPPSPRYKS